MNMRKQKKKKNMTLAQKRSILGYAFVSPFIIGFLFFMLRPLLESLRMAFSEVVISVGNGGFLMKFNGIENFKKAFLVDPEFTRLLTEEISSMLIDVPATLIFSFFVALILNQSFKGRGFVRAIFFLPVILSSGVLVGLEYNNTLLQGMEDIIKSSGDSSITNVLQSILITDGMGSKFMEVLFDIVDHVYDIAISSGIQIVIFLSGLQTISKSMYEAADIEGCTAWESFWKITFPMVSSTILVNLVYTIIDCFIRTDNEVMSKISDTMMIKMDYGFSSAMAWVYFGAVMVIIAVFSAIVSKGVYYYDS